MPAVFDMLEDILTPDERAELEESVTRFESLSRAQRIAILPKSEQSKFFSDYTDAQLRDLMHVWEFWARPEQMAPPGNWFLWILNAGRGFGKSRAGAEWLVKQAETAGRHLGLVGETAAEVRDVMIEGPSGILACAKPWNMPEYQPSKRRVVWPNGTWATTYSGDSPNQLRGPNLSHCWVDEFCKFRYPEETWDGLEFVMRAESLPQVCMSTTPRPIKKYKELLKDPQAVVSGGSTYQNIVNLAPSFLRRMIARFHHTRFGLQELLAKMLDDAEGSLWKRDRLDMNRIGHSALPDLKRIVIGVDPAGSIHTETGIVVSGVGVNDHVYTLDDCTVAGTPGEWGAAVVDAWSKWDANLIAVETNHGGDMCIATIQSAAKDKGVEVVCRKMTASKGKFARAEPIAARDEQGKLHHVGSFALLEDELCQWEPGGTDASPNRLDAKVWAETVLFEGIAQEPIIFAPPTDMTQTSRWRG